MPSIVINIGYVISRLQANHIVDEKSIMICKVRSSKSTNSTGMLIGSLFLTEHISSLPCMPTLNYMSHITRLLHILRHHFIPNFRNNLGVIECNMLICLIDVDSGQVTLVNPNWR
jgi:hypothetical protein